MNRQLTLVPLLLILVLSTLPILKVIEAYYFEFSNTHGVYEKDILYKIFGETRGVLSSYSMIKSEEYLHGGIPHPALHDHSIHEDPTKEHDEKKEHSLAKIPHWDILPYIAEFIHLDIHVVLPPNQEKELLPWYFMAAKLNPHNVNAYVLGGFWMGRGMHKADDAIPFLKEGIKNNPAAWEIYEELGMVYSFEKKDFVSAAIHFKKAIENFSSEVTESKRINVLKILAYCYENLKDYKNEKDVYERILILDSVDTTLQNKIEELKAKIN